jgi:23S rRNA pseudouridine1911/1915/1917 synthase
VNSKAKQRAWIRASATPEPSSAGEPAQQSPLLGPLLTAPEGRVSFEAAERDGGERLDRFLGLAAAARRLALSRTRLKALIEAGRVTIDGQVVRDAAARLAAGARVEVEAPAPDESPARAQALPLDILFEDQHLLVLDKPAGLVVHPAAGHEDGTLVNALIAHCGDSLSGIGGVKRPGIVHRLDKDTSGLLVVAKSDAAHQGLSALFADHGRTGSLVREYLALVWGTPPAKGAIDAPLGRHPHQREKMAVVGEERGRRAVTHWRLEEELGPASLVSCRLETGRTHQIRVHFAHIGHPILGDAVYGAGYKSKATQLSEEERLALAKLGRQALHAAKLGFVHPATGEELLFESAPPADLLRLINALRERWRPPHQAAKKGSL